jgi:hypothetical protein
MKWENGMVHQRNDSHSREAVGQLLSSVEFPKEGKKVLRAMNERINDLTRENLRPKKRKHRTSGLEYLSPEVDEDSGKSAQSMER